MKSRNFFALFFVCALVPLVAAKLSLIFGWFSHEGTNKGVWMEKEVQLLADMAGTHEHGADAANVHWRVVYVQAEKCDQYCEQALLTLQQLYSGLGRKQLKIQTMALAPVRSSSQLLQQLPDIDWEEKTIRDTDLQNHIVIVNQRGLALLRYPVTGTPEQMRDLAKNVRTDLMHLINYDRSGT